MFEIIEYLKAKKKGNKTLARIFADEILRLKGEDFTAAIDLLAEEQKIDCLRAHRRLLADATIGKYIAIGAL